MIKIDDDSSFALAHGATGCYASAIPLRTYLMIGPMLGTERSAAW